jgi:fumarate reductase subunit D
MAKSNKPIVWGLFAAGGTITAFFTPVMIFITGLAVPLGIMNPEVLAYDRIHSLLDNWLWKLAVFVFISLSLWHAAHRLRITAHDFGLRGDGLVATVVYLLATLGTVVAAIYLVRI